MWESGWLTFLPTTVIRRVLLNAAAVLLRTTPPLLHNPPPIIVATLHAHWHCQPSHARRQRRRRCGRWCLSIGGRTTVPRHQCPSLAHKRGVGDNGDLAPSAVPCARNDKSRGGGADNIASASTAAQWRWRQGGRQRLGIDGRPSRAQQQ